MSAALHAGDYLYLRYTPSDDISFEDIAALFLRDNLSDTEKENVKENLWGNEKKYQNEILKEGQEYYLYIPQETIDPQKLSIYLKSKNTEEEVKLDLQSMRKNYKREFVAQAAYRLENINSNTDDANLKMVKNQLYLSLEVFNIYSLVNTKFYATIDTKAQNEDYGFDIHYNFISPFGTSHFDLLLGSKLVHSDTFKASDDTSLDGDENVLAIYVGGEFKVYIINEMSYLKNLKLSTYYYLAIMSRYTNHEQETQNLPGDLIGMRLSADISDKAGWFFESSKRVFQGSNAINFTAHLLGLEYIF